MDRNELKKDLEEAKTLLELSEVAWKTAEIAGFHDVDCKPATWAANLHGEVSEFWEAYRTGKLRSLCDKAERMAIFGITPLECAEEELADVMIRAMDIARQMGIDIEHAVRSKMAFNLTRSFRHGGKLA